MLAANTSAAGARKKKRIMTFPPSACRWLQAPAGRLATCARVCRAAGPARPARSPRRARGAGACPALGQRVVGLLGVDPTRPPRFVPRRARKFDLLPERRTGLEVVHEE